MTAMPFDANNNDTMMQWLAARLDRLESRGDQNFNILNERITALERNGKNTPQRIDITSWQAFMWGLMISIGVIAILLLIYLGGNAGVN